VLFVAQAYVAAAAEMSMKEQLQSCAVRIAARIQDVSSDMDPEILQLPGGSVIATLLWLYNFTLERRPICILPSCCY
jgi:hypothetical protein